MSVNFFRTDCQHQPLSVDAFGLCDKQDGTRAYPDTMNKQDWIATVLNPEHLQVTFTAIDKCVLKDDEYPESGRCDGMVTTHLHLYLVELKDKRADWQPAAIVQLKSTIDLLLATHDISQFKKKKAFAVNRKHQKFAIIDNEENLALFRRTGFRIDSQAEILLVS